MTPVKTELEDDTKLYRSISEVSELVGVKPHVLRYWETQFSMLRPRKNRAGNRMYRPEEIQLLMRIRDLLYQRRFTIAGARRRLLDQRKETPQVELGFDDSNRKLLLHEVKTELRRLLDRLRDPEKVARR
ncbi:MAG: MerR family transcriptional regulator [Candidatus Eiseniibacteriota bacterium]